MKRYILSIFVVGLVALTGCSNEKLPRFTVVQGLRVLTLVASDPEVEFNSATQTFNPGTVTLTPWISDVYGAGRTLNYSVYWCLDPGVGRGATPTCESNATQTTVASGTVSAGAADAFQSPNYVGAAADISVNLNAAGVTEKTLIAQAFNAKTAAERYNGVALLIFYELTPSSAASEKVTAFKRVLLTDSSKSVKNANPTGLEIRVNGVEITSLPTTKTDLAAYLPPNQAESYTLLTEQGVSIAQTESLDTTWFLTGPADVECSRKDTCTTDGLLFLSRSSNGEANRFTPPTVAVPTTRGRVLVAVGRDGRGGLVVKRYCDGAGALCP
jgi:hypothetical protein